MRLVDHVKTNAHTTDEVTELERRNRELSGHAAEEGMVLLENDGTLPLKAGERIALFGRGATHTVKGGSGSGEVYGRKATSVYGGLKKEGFAVTTERKLSDYVQRVRLDQRDYIAKKQQEAGNFRFSAAMSVMEHPYFPPEFPHLAEDDLTDPKDVCVYVISRISGEGYDRKNIPGDFQLSEREIQNLKLCASHYERMIIVLNAGGILDLTPLDEIPHSALIYMSMAGAEGGTALAGILNGRVNPSGHLTETWPCRYEDIPFANDYAYLNGNTKEEYYDEGIYVGYRYFDTWRKPVRYPFGYGLSYTKFQPLYDVSFENNVLHVQADVKNTGDRAGKYVLEIYASAPEGELDKEYQRLVGFAKTDVIEAGKSNRISADISLRDLASFDQMTAEWVLEPGVYTIRAGENSRHTENVAYLSLPERTVLSKLDHICLQLEHLDELKEPGQRPDGTCEENNEKRIPGIPLFTIDPKDIRTEYAHYQEPGIPDDIDSRVMKWLHRLSPSELADIVVGTGSGMLLSKGHTNTVPGAVGYTTAKYERLGITDLAFADGPAGLRLQQKSVALKKKNRVKAITPQIEQMKYMPKAARKMIFGKPKDGTVLYQYPTAWPVGTALAQTWNMSLMEQVGEGINAELEEYGVTFWLGPGVNIMRNPLCGRNYEYYSEDPYLAGRMAAAIIRGVQSKGIHYATLKHFLCNSQETNRQFMNVNVSERALREIYLPAFERGVREGHARAVMSSYNMVNGVYSDMNRDTLIKVLRCEWKFDGIVMTDWDGAGRAKDAAHCIEAGTDILMSGNTLQRQVLRRALRSGKLDPKYIERSAAHILTAVAESEEQGQ